MATILNGVTLSAYTQVAYTIDPDAAAYIAAVEDEDDAELEPSVKTAINDFVVGCKADGIWSAIKASCIMAGARTLEGALVPLVGTSPTNANFVSGDYNRKTGLVGNGSTKYLDSNRAGNADPQNNNHAAVFVSSAQISGTGAYLGHGTPTQAGNTQIGSSVAGGTTFFRNKAALVSDFVGAGSVGFLGSSRTTSGSFIRRALGASVVANIASDGNLTSNILIFSRGSVSSLDSVSSGRLSFYSIGESLDIAKLDARVSSLMSALNSAIV
jgi:hypothetical protein